jgi:Sec23-binding domain of Sec16
MIKRNLLIGNFQCAAECALKVGRTAEAFIIAQMGGAEMLEDIQRRYFDMQKDPYLSSILKQLFAKNLKSVIESAESTWQEKLAYIFTYVD